MDWQTVAFGRPFIANPDLPERYRLGLPLPPLMAASSLAATPRATPVTPPQPRPQTTPPDSGNHFFNTTRRENHESHCVPESVPHQRRSVLAGCGFAHAAARPPRSADRCESHRREPPWTPKSAPVPTPSRASGKCWAGMQWALVCAVGAQAVSLFKPGDQFGTPARSTVPVPMPNSMWWTSASSRTRTRLAA